MLFETRLGVRRHGRKLGGLGLGQAFIRRADGGALRVQVGIVEIGFDQRSADRFGVRWRSGPETGRDRGDRHERRALKARAPPTVGLNPPRNIVASCLQSNS